VVYRLSFETAGGAKGGRALCAQRIAGRPLADPALQPEVQRVVEAGKPVTLARAAELECFLPLVPGVAPPPALRGEVLSMGVPKENLDDAFGELSSAGRVSLRGIGFETGSAKLLSDSERALKAVKELLDKDRALSLLIEGHTDDVGSEADNKKLSQERAETVLEWLVSHGVAKGRLEAAGFGEERPIADNTLEEGRALNRRVDLVKR
jgi:outer membrane protein OmpA-like peptidoglycan-associated protein